MQLHIESTSALMTEHLAEKIGKKLIGGEVIELASDLGGGKTTFVRGLAHGLGSQNKVVSPSFTIANQYQAGDLSIYHFDFYRLDAPGIMANELAEILTNPKAIVVIEWGNIVRSILSTPHLIIHIKQTDENKRQLDLSYPDSYKYLIDDLES